MIADKKDWISNRAEELSQELYSRDFHSNGPHIQLMLWIKAEQDYIDYYASEIDFAYNCIRDRQMLG